MRHVAYNWVWWSVELAVVIFQSTWTIIFGIVDNLDLLWVDMAGVCRGYSLQVGFERVTSPCNSVVWLFTAQLLFCWLLRRRRIHSHPCQNDRACLRLDRMVRLFTVWEIRRTDDRYDLLLIPCKIHRILHLIHRYIINFILKAGLILNSDQVSQGFSLEKSLENLQGWRLHSFCRKTLPIFSLYPSEPPLISFLTTLWRLLLCLFYDLVGTVKQLLGPSKTVFFTSLNKPSS